MAEFIVRTVRPVAAEQHRGVVVPASQVPPANQVAQHDTRLAACAVGLVTHLNGSDEDTWRLVVRGAILARMEVEVATLTGNALADPPHHLDEEKVARYTQILDQLPPVVVFQLGDGLLLVDGYHRVEAARRLGRRVVRAEVRQGSREDALRFAVDLAANERGLTQDQALDAISRRSGKRWGLK